MQDNPVHLLLAVLSGGMLFQILAIIFLKMKNNASEKKWELAEENHGGLPESPDSEKD